ncbi:group I truncated hemoglobin [Steroidobacter sp.]|uniref:group I truncated hemoglobin n=1 Tax=Steroidobacter sp. TaxID=1978227 RepID=UPI001A4CC96C|nr:group 1 truncated hemoglobin [Steroidobacter sp.]MBL8265541.1 group 1 truncated hemoglobin [Steroidobacter sp.]
MSKSIILATLLSTTLLAASFAPVAHAEKTLYEQIGGEPVLRKTVEEFVVIMEDDDRINFAFGNTDITKFKQLLFEQLCNVTGGPCEYTGRSMEESHRELAIDNAMFNALAEDVYLAFDRVGVPYRLQNKVMAIFAPMQKDMVK